MIYNFYRTEFVIDFAYEIRWTLERDWKEESARQYKFPMVWFESFWELFDIIYCLVIYDWLIDDEPVRSQHFYITAVNDILGNETKDFFEGVDVFQRKQPQNSFIIELYSDFQDNVEVYYDWRGLDHIIFRAFLHNDLFNKNGYSIR